MDSTSQTSADEDDFVNEFERFRCNTLPDTTFDVPTGCCAKDIVDKLMLQLKEKDEQLKENKKALEEFHNKIRELEFKLLMTEAIKKRRQEMNAVLQMSLWKSFPSVQLKYYIKMPFGGYYYADDSGYLCTSTVNDDHKGYFQFKKNADGTYSIYSNSKAKYLQIQTSSGKSAASVMFCANLLSKSKFVLIFHPQQNKQHPGIVVDIYSLENGCFLSVANDVNDKNRLVVVANSPIAPLDKFLIIVDGVE